MIHDLSTPPFFPPNACQPTIVVPYTFQDAVWLARRRLEAELTWQAINRPRQRVWRGVISWTRRVLLTVRLPCPRPRRRKKESVTATLTDDGTFSTEGGVDKKMFLEGEDGGVRTPVVTEERGGGLEAGGGEGGGGGDARGVITTGRGDGGGGGGDSDPVKNARSGSWLPVWSSGTDGTSSGGGGGGGSSPFTASGDGEWRKRKAASKGATAAAMAAAEGKTAYPGGGDGGGGGGGGGSSSSKNDLKGRRRHHRRATAQPGRLEEYLRRRRKASVGMIQALQAEREARAYASEEYALALSDFESDHSLEITW